jgi:diguanylate cyclase (GGDEF)-like protein
MFPVVTIGNSDLPSLIAGLDAMLGAGGRLLDTDSVAETLRRTAEAVAALVPYDELSIYELDPDGAACLPAFAAGRFVEQVLAEPFSVEEGVTGWVMRSRRTRYVADTGADPISVPITGTGEPDESLVCAPMVVNGRLVGTLNAYRTAGPRPFSEVEVGLFERFGTMAGLAFDAATTRERLRNAARSDALTGLLNHGALHKRLRALQTEAERRGEPLSLVLLDVDHFKRINDRFGHAEGDRVLRELAAAMRRRLRDGDAIGRVGGEEFAVVLPRTEAEQALEVAGRLRAAATDTRVGGDPVRCSGGVATWPADVRDPGDLLEAADRALYAAKDGGRDCVRRAGASAVPGVMPPPPHRPAPEPVERPCDDLWLPLSCGKAARAHPRFA